jgi:hypothetical protein
MAITPNQGIMALPENQGMQAPQLSLSDSYDAMQQGLMQARPDAYMEMQESLAEIRPELEELTDQQLELLIQALQELYNDPENYAARVQELVKNSFLESAEELPPEYDEEFIATLLMVLVDIQRTRQGMTAPMPQPDGGMPQMEGGMPAGMMPPPQQFARGGIADAARMLASQGRNGDTMLAHITPEEARLLKSLGGSGTINPQTGLPEFWPLLSRKRGIGKTITKALSSPLGRIIGTIALGMVLGPAVGSIMSGFSTAAVAATTSALSSGLVTAAAGGDLKSALTSAAVGFITAGGGPVSNYVGKYTGQFISNPAVLQAANATLLGTGVGLATGQNFKDAVKSGLTEGVIAGGTAYLSGANKTQADQAAKDAAADVTTNGPKLNPLEDMQDQLDSQGYIDKNLKTFEPNKGTGGQKLSINDAVSSGNLKSGSQYVGADGLLRTYVGADPTTGQHVFETPLGPRVVISNAEANAANVAKGAYKVTEPRNDIFAPKNPPPVTTSTATPSSPVARDLKSGIFGTPEAKQTIANQGLSIREAAARAAESGIPDLPSSVGSPTAAGPYRQPGIGESFGEMGSGAKKFLTGDFSEGAGQMYKGASDLFAPGPSAEQRTAMIDDFMAKNPGKSVGDAIKYVDEMSPGIMRTYGPAAVAGIGALGMAGGFEQNQPEPVNRGPSGMDLLQQDPSKYLVQGLPGVQYGAQGNIMGGQAYSSPFTMANVRVPSAYSLPAMFASGGIAALAQGGYPRKVGQISGPGTEKSDSIPAMLSDGEFVMTAAAVRGAGGGSRREGAKRMYALMHQLERNAARG